MNAEEQFKIIRVVHRAGRLVREDHGNMPPNTEKFDPAVEAQIEEAAANHPEYGLVPKNENQNPGPLDDMANQILDDALYNVLHELLLETYQQEKSARCNTAAIILEQKAQETLGLDPTSGNNFHLEAAKAKIHTEIAYFDNEGNTSLVQDEKVPFPPLLQAIKVVYCPDCRLPRFPYPTAGEGSRIPEPGIEYCKKRTFVQNYPADVYNQIYTADRKGPGKGNGKKKAKEDTPNGSQDSPAPSPPSNDTQEKLVPVPHVKCPVKDCNKHYPANKMGSHVSRNHGTGRRAANRDATEKMQNMNGYASNGSRNVTPGPTNGSRSRSSPNKRDIDEFGSDESPQKPKKAKTTTNKKLKAPPMTKTSSQLSSSNLNHVETQHSDDDFADDGDDHRDGDFGAISVDSKKKKKATPKTTKSKAGKTVKNGDGNYGEKKKKATKTTAAKKPRPVTPPDSKTKVKTEVNGSSNGNEVNGSNVNGNEVNGNGTKPNESTGPRGDSESSQTLSSP